MTVYYRWWLSGRPGGVPEQALDEAAALRLIRGRYPHAALGDWSALPEAFQLVADEQRLVWENEQARQAGASPVADLLRVW